MIIIGTIDEAHLNALVSHQSILFRIVGINPVDVIPLCSQKHSKWKNSSLLSLPVEFESDLSKDYQPLGAELVISPSDRLLAAIITI